MRKKHLLIFFYILFNFLLINNTYGQGYIVEQITTTTGYNKRYPSINNHGNIVWSKQVGSFWQIFKDGSQITTDNYNKKYPAISDSGDIVYVKYGVGGGIARQVIRHPSSVIEFSSRSCDWIGCRHRDASEHPDISLDGEIIWYYDWWDYWVWDPVRRLNTNQRGRIRDNLYPGDYPSILTLTGEYVWQEEDIWGKRIYSSVTGYIDVGEIPRISEYGIVYISEGYIKIYKDGVRCNIKNEKGDRIQSSYADINDKGELVYEKLIGGFFEIFKATPSVSIMLDPGHGNYFFSLIPLEIKTQRPRTSPPPIAHNVVEDELTLQLANATVSALNNLCLSGIHVSLTRNDSFLLTPLGCLGKEQCEVCFADLKERVKLANAKNVDAFVSIHSNALGCLTQDHNTSAHGLELFICGSNSDTKRLAEEILNKVLEGGELKKRMPPIKKKCFYILKKTKMPACLIEVGFWTNYGSQPNPGGYIRNETLLSQQSFRTAIGKRIADGISEWLQN